MPNHSYYPPTNDGRVGWWQQIADNAGTVLTPLGLPAADIASIDHDAHWAIYAYGTVRKAFDDFSRAVTRYADEILHGTPNGVLPEQPVAPDFPPAPTPAIVADLETRREQWVKRVKAMPGYNATVGAQLGLEASRRPFDPASYQCELYGLSVPNAHAVGGKFRKASGQVDSIRLYGRKLGAAGWTPLGSFTATPFSASVPVTGPAPEQWEFQARAVRRDVEFGLPSDIIEQIVRP